MLFDRHNKLGTCHPVLIDICRAVANRIDIVVCYGYRGEAEQNSAYARGASKLKYPNSKHNQNPSLAVDLAPTKDKGNSINWNDIDSFKEMAKIFLEEAHIRGVDIVWGGNWKMRDYPHFEINRGSK